MSFIDFATLGKNAWWRYLLSFFSIMGAGFLIQGALAFAIVFAGYEELLRAITGSDVSASLTFLEQVTVFVVILGSIAAFLPAILIFAPLFHRRSWRSFVHGGLRFNWAGFRASVVCALIVMVMVFTISLLYDPETIMVANWSDFEWGRWLIFCVLALLLLPFQVMAEEVFVRGYLMQAVAKLTASFWPRLLIPALVFSALHLANPEAIAGGIWAFGVYFVMSVYLGLLVFRGNGLEYAIGFHLTGNVFAALIAGYQDSVLNTPTLAHEGAPQWNFSGVLGYAVLVVIHFVLLSLWMRFKHKGWRGTSLALTG